MASDFPFAGYSNIILHFSSLSLFSWFFFYSGECKCPIALE